jgi:anti-sigma factor RsiW
VTGSIEKNGVIARLLGPEEPEVSCETCFEELDRYVDLELAGVDADAAIPGLRAHLEGCPACREEHESLRSMVASDALYPRVMKTLEIDEEELALLLAAVRSYLDDFGHEEADLLRRVKQLLAKLQAAGGD